MAIRIPTYEQHVQLDSGAQTLPRFSADLTMGKGLKEAGIALSHVAAHWKAKQDGYDKLQLTKNTALLHEQITQIIAEETAKFDPTNQRPGELHDAIAKRVQPLIDKYRANGLQYPNLAKDYNINADTATTHTSQTAAHNDATKRNKATLDSIDSQVAALAAALNRNPDAHGGASAKVDKIIEDLSAFGNLTPQQKEAARRGALTTIYKSVIDGYAKQGRPEDGKVFSEQFTADRQAEEKKAADAAQAERNKKVVPGPGAAAPKPVEPGNIDVTKQPQVKNADGTTSTVRSITIEEDGKHVVIPTVSSDGRIMSNKEAVQRYRDTGEHLGIYGSAADANKAAEALHKSEEQRIQGGGEVVPMPQPRPGGAPRAEGDVTPDQPDQTGQPQVKLASLSVDQPIPSGEARPLNDTGYNQKRIAEIDAKPKIKAAIEKVAMETGMDPNMLKVVASIESDGNPNSKSPSGKHHGLFQLTTAEFGLHNGGKGDINNPEDNARAAANLLQANAAQIRKETGQDPSAEELYISHNQGVGGLIAHMKNPDQPAWKTMLATSEGQQKGEAWAKKAVAGNVPADVLRRNYGGDATKVSSSDFVAIKGAQVSGGDVDFAVAMRRDGQEQPQKRIVVASADGNVATDASAPQGPSYIGGMNVGAPQYSVDFKGLPTLQGYKMDRSTNINEVGAHGYTGRGALRGVSVAPWLVESVKAASATLPEGYQVKVISTVDPRDTGTRWHPTGRAIDIQIVDPQGKEVPNVGPPSRPGWDLYENMAAAAKAYAKDKFGKDMTWGGHFNTGTPFDRMHFQVGGAEGGGSARSFTPQQIEGGRQAYLKVVNQPPTDGTVQVASNEDYWTRLHTSGTTALDGSNLRASQMKTAMNESLKKKIEDDIGWTKDKGTGLQLPKSLQDYYKTDKLTYELISNHLGTPAAISWQERKDYAQKYYETVKDLPVASNKVISDTLAGLEKDLSANSGIDKKSQDLLIKEANEKARQIINDRMKDPGGYADKFAPNVKAAYDAALADPANPEKAKALVDARLAAQREWGVPAHLQSPISNAEAKSLAAPLSNLADPDPSKSAAKQQVAQSVYAITGGNIDLAEKTMRRVLEQGKISKDVAQQTAQVLQQIQVDKNNAGIKLTKEQEAKKAQDEALAASQRYDAMFGLPGYDVYRPSEAPPRGPISQLSVAGEHGAFSPGDTFIPRSEMETLLKNKDNPKAIEEFNIQYGGGAAEHVIRGGVVSPSAPELPPAPGSQTEPAKPEEKPPVFVWPQPDPLQQQDEEKPDETSGGP